MKKGILSIAALAFVLLISFSSLSVTMSSLTVFGLPQPAASITADNVSVSNNIFLRIFISFFLIPVFFFLYLHLICKIF